MLILPLRLLWRHWPALVAWFLGGMLARYWVIKLAGFVGGHWPTGGMLLVPIAILFRLVSFVAMFLVLRDGMRTLNQLSPEPEGKRASRRAFMDAVLGGIIPFFTFYVSFGYLRDDMVFYTQEAMLTHSGNQFTKLAETGLLTEHTPYIAADFDLSLTTIAMALVAYTFRWLWKKKRSHFPSFLAPLALYAEAIWVFITLTLIRDGMSGVTAWVDGRVAMDWAQNIREVISDWFDPLIWVWDSIAWVIGALGSVILEPLAWLTIAGVIYGQAVAANAPQVQSGLLTRARGQYDRIPSALQRRLKDVGVDFASRFTPIWKAWVLMWRSGPLLIGTYVLVYSALVFAQGLLTWGLPRLLGPHEFGSFWLVVSPALFLLVPLIIEPIKFALVAGSYDETLAKLRNDRGTEETRELVGDVHPDVEGA